MREKEAPKKGGGELMGKEARSYVSQRRRRGLNRVHIISEVILLGAKMGIEKRGKPSIGYL